MAVNQNIYPYSIQVNNLPIFLYGIGGSEYQYHVVRPDGYPWTQVLYSAAGRGFLKYDGNTINLSGGCYFFLPANYPHEYYPADGNWDVRWVAFGGVCCNDIFSELHLTKPLARRFDDSSVLQRLYKQMFVSQKSDKVYGNYICSGLAYQYVMEFYKLVSDKNTSGGNDRSAILMPVINYIDNHYSEDFPLTLLADKAGVTPQHLCRVFKETMNVRPGEYLVRRRLTEAKRLLLQTSMPISAIGVRVGFSDPSYFSAVFRKYECISPCEYRKRNFL